MSEKSSFSLNQLNHSVINYVHDFSKICKNFKKNNLEIIYKSVFLKKNKDKNYYLINLLLEKKNKYMQIYLHVGIHRTGSTFLQKNIFPQLSSENSCFIYNPISIIEILNEEYIKPLSKLQDISFGELKKKLKMKYIKLSKKIKMKET